MTAKTTKKQPVTNDVTKDLKSSLMKLKKLKAAKSVLKKKMDLLNANIEPLIKDLFETMVAMDIKNININGDTFYTKLTPYFSVTDKQKAIKWVKKNHPEIMSYTYGTLNSLLKDCYVIKGKKLPVFFKQFDKESVGIRAGKK
jgi:hypothetical protein